LVLQSAQLSVGKRSVLPSVLQSGLPSVSQSAQLSVGKRSELPSVLQSAVPPLVLQSVQLSVAELA
jgi:hypothetical protein